MSENPARIIEEYLELVREKLPESIADDVITELETYMMESASELGEDGQITFSSAKKVVAQFGAPGEVADEYRYSMLPETIPKDDIPTEIIHETKKVDEQQRVVETEESPSKTLGVDPTTSYSFFLLKTVILMIICAIIVSAITQSVSPISYGYWLPNWQVIMIAIELSFGFTILLAQTLILKRNKVILWKRSYPEWSALQTLVTLPENSNPEGRNTTRKLDMLVTFLGLLLFIPLFLQWYQGWFVLIGGVAIVLFTARLIMIYGKLNDEKDPYENSRFEFIINLALLVTINVTVYWMFATGIGPFSYFIMWVLPLLAFFVPPFGTILLLQIVTGIQNLWWKKQKESSAIQISQRPKSDPEKEVLIEKIPDVVGKIFAEIILILCIFNIVPIYLSATIHSAYMYSQFESRVAGLLIGIAFAGILLICYFLARYTAISRFNYKRIIGQRTRGEALVDVIISSFGLIIGASMFLFSAVEGLEFNVPFYQEHLSSFLLAYVLATLELVQAILLSLGFLFRIFGDSMEFVSVWKRRAISWIKQSGILLITSITILVAIDYYKHIVLDAWYLQYEIIYWVFIPFMIFLSFQVSTSSLKLRLEKEKESPKKTKDSVNVNQSIAN